MRNDHKSWKQGVRVAKQFGGALAGRLGAAARPIARTLGYKTVSYTHLTLPTIYSV